MINVEDHHSITGQNQAMKTRSLPGTVKVAICMLHVRLTDLYLVFEKGLCRKMSGRLARYWRRVTRTLDA